MLGAIKPDIFPLDSDSTLGGFHKSGDLQLDVTQELARISTLQQDPHASIPQTGFLVNNS